jgi:hypothetical protein
MHSPTAAAVQAIVRIRDGKCVGVPDLIGDVDPLA